MTQCPHHMNTLGARAGDCRECDREVTPPTDAYRAAKALAKQIRHTTPRRESPTLADLSDAPTRAEGEQQS